MAEQPEQSERALRSRVWAEVRGEGEVLLTWQRADAEAGEIDQPADARAVAATVSVLAGVTSVTTGEGGVIVHFDPDIVSRPQLANAVRAALNLDADLRTRGNEMLKRAPAYLGLAKSLALDDRVSPVPEAARQAAATRSTSLRTAGALPVAGRFIPGLPMITRLHSLVPVLKALGSWSREASPEAVEEHLQNAGLTRDQLDRDLATAQEAVAFARDFAAEKVGTAAATATTAALQARAKAREWAKQYGERTSSKKE
jgi:hypothetical protein